MSYEVVRFGELSIHLLQPGEVSGGSVALIEVEVPSGAKVPIAHSHKDYEETIYGLEGAMTWTVEGVAQELAPGEVLCIPRGAVHRFDNHGPTHARVLAVITPGVLSFDYFRELSRLIVPGQPTDHERLAEIMLRHGLTAAP